MLRITVLILPSKGQFCPVLFCFFLRFQSKLLKSLIHLYISNTERLLVAYPYFTPNPTEISEFSTETFISLFCIQLRKFSFMVKWKLLSEWAHILWPVHQVLPVGLQPALSSALLLLGLCITLPPTPDLLLTHLHTLGQTICLPGSILPSPSGSLHPGSA